MARSSYREYELLIDENNFLILLFTVYSSIKMRLYYIIEWTIGALKKTQYYFNYYNVTLEIQEQGHLGGSVG